jgi:hypothetical protein
VTYFKKPDLLKSKPLPISVSELCQVFVELNSSVGSETVSFVALQQFFTGDENENDWHKPPRWNGKRVASNLSPHCTASSRRDDS